MKYTISLFIAIMLGIVLVHPLFAEAILPPLKQLKSGIIEYNVQCADNMYLTLSPIENRIACVKIDTAQKLAERGWTSFIPQTPDNAALVLKQCNDSPPPIYSIPDNMTNDSIIDPNVKLYSTTYWWMPLNSIVKICVKYNSTYDNIPVPLYILEHNSYNDAKLMIKASQEVISKGTTVVSYEIHTGNQKGQYLMSIDCMPSFVVIGSDTSELNRTDFPILMHAGCPAFGPNNSSVVGTSGVYLKHFE